MCDERYDLLALIPAQGSDGMETVLAETDARGSPNYHALSDKIAVSTDTCYVRITRKRGRIRRKCIRIFCSK